MAEVDDKIGKLLKDLDILLNNLDNPISNKGIERLHKQIDQKFDAYDFQKGRSNYRNKILYRLLNQLKYMSDANPNFTVRIKDFQTVHPSIKIEYNGDTTPDMKYTTGLLEQMYNYDSPNMLISELMKTPGIRINTLDHLMNDLELQSIS